VFFSVLVFGAVLAGARTIQSPFVQPAALIRKDDRQEEGVLGLYIAETSDRVWLGVICQRKKPLFQAEPNSGRMFWIAKSDVVAMSIGPLQRLHKARDNAPGLLASLIALRIPATKQPKRADRNPDDEPCVRTADGCLHKNTPPTASVTIRRLAGEPSLLTLDATSSSDPDGTVKDHRWRLPGPDKQGRPVIHYRQRRNQTATVTIRLTVTDDKGASGERKIELLAPIPAQTLFATDRAELRRSGRIRLRNRLRRALEKLSRLDFVRVEGHTDNTGSEAHNQRLSERRAATVARFIETRFNIPKRLIRPRGAGEQLPRATNDTADGRRKNRRVELLVVRRSG
jgi:outer membrane protein OmpA-like peptidoglycan-associated protein